MDVWIALERLRIRYRRAVYGDRACLQDLISETETAVSDAERTVAEIISDLQTADTVNGLLALQVELNMKRESLRQCRVRLFPGQHMFPPFEELEHEIQRNAPPRDHIEEWKRETKSSNLGKVWDLVPRANQVPVVPLRYGLTEGRDDIREVEMPVKRTEGDSHTVSHLRVSVKSSPISLEIGPVSVNHIVDDRIEQSVDNVILAKIDWTEELARGQELRRKKQRLVRQLEREQVIGQQQQEEARERAEQQLADLHRRHKEEKKKEKERFKHFYIGAVKTQAQPLKILMKKVGNKAGLRDVINHLFENFDVRLLAVDTGLRFLMDVPMEEYEEVLRQQDDIKQRLGQALLPNQNAEWTQVTSVNLQSDETDLQLGQPLSVQADSQVFGNAGTAEVTS
ncbi:hypothetical protein BaRGS_00018808, partial [Batillaria attramentaria]